MLHISSSEENCASAGGMLGCSDSILLVSSPLGANSIAAIRFKGDDRPEACDSDRDPERSDRDGDAVGRFGIPSRTLFAFGVSSGWKSAVSPTLHLFGVESRLLAIAAVRLRDSGGDRG